MGPLTVSLARPFVVVVVVVVVVVFSVSVVFQGERSSHPTRDASAAGTR